MPLDLRPARLDVDAIVGNDVAIVCTVTDSNGAAVDVSGYTIQADVYRAGSSVATFTDVVGGASNNVVTLSLTDAQMTTLGADSASMTWSWRVTNGTDTREWVAGRFRVYTVGAAGNTTTTAVALTVGSVSVSVSVIGSSVSSVNGETGAVSLIASEIPFTPTGTVAATNVQAAIAEVASEASGGGVSDGDKGDITVSGSGSVWTIDNGAVTAAKVAADVATQAELDAVAAAAQPLDADLTAVAGLTPTNDDVLQRKAGAWTNRTIAQLLTDLAAPGTTFQPLDSDLTAIAALTTTAYGRAVLELANQAALMALLSAASDTAAGKVELATSAETATGTDATRAVTPAGAAATYQPLDADLTALAAANNSAVLAATTASFLTADETKLDGIAAGAIAGVRVEDEGVSTVASAVALNFAGSGVTVTNAGSNEALVTISGGGSSDPLDANNLIATRIFAR